MLVSRYWLNGGGRGRAHRSAGVVVVVKKKDGGATGAFQGGGVSEK